MNSDKDGWRGFLTLCSKAASLEEFEAIFGLFLTLEEKEMLGRRYLVVRALEEGSLTQREIAETFKVSISQISRGSNALKIINSKLRDFLKNEMK